MESKDITTDDLNSSCEDYAQRLNGLFIEKGIGWQFQDGKIIARGPEIFEDTVKHASEALSNAGHRTAYNELQQAYLDVSKRPEPDLTGAVQHALAALECTAREVSGLKKATLGEIVKKSPELFPQPLDDIAKKIWGYASEKGRHLREGEEPDFSEVMLLIGLAASMAGFLNKETLSGEKLEF